MSNLLYDVSNFVSGECIRVVDHITGVSASSFSIAFTCFGSSASSNWTAQMYLDSNCGGVPYQENGYGSQCFSVFGLYDFSIDCTGTVNPSPYSVTPTISVTPSTPPAKCYSSASTVVLESGNVIPYPDLKVGDRVLAVSSTGEPFFDKVFRITHHDTESPTEFVVITTTSGDKLELSSDHMLHSGTCCSLSSLVSAGKVTVGDTVFVSTPTESVRAVNVASIGTVIRNGRFNAHTIGGHIVVDGIVSSHFTTETGWGPDSIEYSHLWYRLVDLGSNIIGAEDASAKP